MIRVIIGQDLTESPVSVPTLLKLVRTVLWRWISGEWGVGEVVGDGVGGGEGVFSGLDLT